MSRLPLKIAPSHGDLHFCPIHASLGQLESTSQTASRSVQPFLAQLTAECPYTLQWAPSSPKLLLPNTHGGFGPHLTHDFWVHPSLQRKRHLDRFSRFAELTSVTDRWTDRPRYSVGNNRPHLRTYSSTAMRPIIKCCDADKASSGAG